MSLPDALSTIALAIMAATVGIVAAAVILAGSAVYCCRQVLKVMTKKYSKSESSEASA